MDYADLSDAEFREALTRVLRERSEDPSEACGEFLGFCEPILQGHGSLYQTLTRIPRPFRELMAVYQAYGMVEGDGFEHYLESTTPEFDEEVDRGVVLLGHPEVSGVMAEARSVYRSHQDSISNEVDKDLWRRFYDAMPDFEVKILGPELLRRL